MLRIFTDKIKCPCCASKQILEDWNSFKREVVKRSSGTIERSITKYYCIKCHCEFKETIERKIVDK